MSKRQPATDKAPARTGIAALASDDFSVLQSVGGVRGVIESVAPSLVFLVMFVITRDLTLTIIVAAALCVLAIVVRLVQKQTVAGALSGAVMVVICLLAAALSHDARNYYLPSLIINAVWALALLVSLVCRAPGIGLVVEFVASMPSEHLSEWFHEWRADANLYRAYVQSTWLWVALFVVRDAVQGPLWLAGDVTWLGTMTLVLGVPLFALVCWVTYLLIGTPMHEYHRYLKSIAREESKNENMAESQSQSQLQKGDE